MYLAAVYAFETSDFHTISDCQLQLHSPCYALSLQYGSEFNELIYKVPSQSIGVGNNREDSLIDF